MAIEVAVKTILTKGEDGTWELHFEGEGEESQRALARMLADTCSCFSGADLHDLTLRLIAEYSEGAGGGIDGRESMVIHKITFRVCEGPPMGI